MRSGCGHSICRQSPAGAWRCGTSSSRSFSTMCAGNSAPCASRRRFRNFDDVLSRDSRGSSAMLRAARIQPVINGTGILIHTNFGRAPLGPAVMENTVRDRIAATTILNMTLPGERAAVALPISSRACRFLCGAEAATVVNNNAAALVLILRHFCEAAEASFRPHAAARGSRQCAAQE